MSWKILGLDWWLLDGSVGNRIGSDKVENNEETRVDYATTEPILSAIKGSITTQKRRLSEDDPSIWH